MTNDLCLTCANYLGDLSCLAFDRIPASILEAEDDHSSVHPDQEGDWVYTEGKPGEFTPD